MKSTRSIQIQFAYLEAILTNIQIQFAYSEAVLTKGCLDLSDEALEFRGSKKRTAWPFLLYDRKLKGPTSTDISVC